MLKRGYRYLLFTAACAAALVMLITACGRLPVQAIVSGNPTLLLSPNGTTSGVLQSSLSSPPPSTSAPTQSVSPRLPASPPPSSASDNSEKPDKAVIVFSFDDGDVSDYLLAYPILKQFGIRGTSYIVAGFIDEGVPEKMTWTQVKEMSQYGWDFGDHTYTHDRMASMTDKQIKKSLEEVNASFERQGLQPPEIIAYPYGSYNTRVIDSIRAFRKQARLAFYETKFVDLKHVDPYGIPSISADMRSDAELNNVEKIVDRACAKKAIVVFRVHAMYKEKIYDTVCKHPGLKSGNGPQTDSKLFSELVNYCVGKDCDFMTMTELMGLYSN